jgi:hypothetical protein
MDLLSRLVKARRQRWRKGSSHDPMILVGEELEHLLTPIVKTFQLARRMFAKSVRSEER